MISTCIPTGSLKGSSLCGVAFLLQKKWTEIDFLSELSATFERRRRHFRRRCISICCKQIDIKLSFFLFYQIKILPVCTWLFYTDILRYFAGISNCSSSKGNEITRSKAVENTQVRVLYIRPALFWGWKWGKRIKNYAGIKTDWWDLDGKREICSVLPCGLNRNGSLQIRHHHASRFC